MLIMWGSRNAQVSALQRTLKSLGYQLDDDGIFGKDTDAAVRAFQREHGLVDDGKVGEKTSRALQGHDCSDLLCGSNIKEAAARLGVEVAAVYAINEVESRGKGFFAKGKPAILYERHIMRRRLIAHGQRYTGYPKSLVDSKPGGYTGGLAEYRKLESAKQIHEASALESCSWGAFQIMGFHWELLGYASVNDFVDRMCNDEKEHFEALVRFIEANPNLHRALKAKDWATFSAGYNGRDYWRTGHHHKLAAAYERYQRVGG